MGPPSIESHIENSPARCNTPVEEATESIPSPRAVDEDEEGINAEPVVIAARENVKTVSQMLLELKHLHVQLEFCRQNKNRCWTTFFQVTCERMIQEKLIEIEQANEQDMMNRPYLE